MKRTILTLLALIAASELAAQRLAPHPGYVAPGPFITVGAGVGGASGDCELCADWSGGGLTLRSGFGWRLSPRLAVDLNVEGLRWTEGSTEERDVHVSLGAQWRAWRGAVVRLGAGPAIVHQEVSTGAGTTVLEARSFGLVLGAAYDLPFGADFTFSPYFNVRAFGSTGLDLQGATIAPDYSTRTLDVGVATSWSLRRLIWPNDRDKSPE